MAFEKFKNFNQRDVPDLISASALDDQAKANAAALRNKDIMGGISLYNEGMGPDRNPIGDYISSLGEEGVGDMNLSSLTMPEAATGEVAGDVMSGVMPELGFEAMAPEAGMNLASLAAPEAAAGGLEALGLAAPMAELGVAAPAATAGLNASTIGAALAPAAAEVGIGGAAAGAAGSALPPLGIAMALGSILGLFG